MKGVKEHARSRHDLCGSDSKRTANLSRSVNYIVRVSQLDARIVHATASRRAVIDEFRAHHALLHHVDKHVAYGYAIRAQVAGNGSSLASRLPLHVIDNMSLCLGHGYYKSAS